MPDVEVYENGRLVSSRPMTPQELEPITRGENKRTIEERLLADLVTLQVQIDLDPASVIVTTFPQAQAAARDAVRRDREQARILKRLVRHVLQSFESAD